MYDSLDIMWFAALAEDAKRLRLIREARNNQARFKRSDSKC